MNLPNSLTLARIFLVPLVVVVLLTTTRQIHNWAIWCVSLFLGAALTDLFDGYLARRRRQVTTLGRLLDPIANLPSMVFAVSPLPKASVSTLRRSARGK
jgi:CDP-diacylglycerol--glycerol-3-phosphate 3-phosphatidyltransferase